MLYIIVPHAARIYKHSFAKSQHSVRMPAVYTGSGKGGQNMSAKRRNLFSREITLLHRRARSAYEAQDDETFIKLVTCLCKVAEAQSKMGPAEPSAVEVVLRGDPAAQEDA